MGKAEARDLPNYPPVQPYQAVTPDYGLPVVTNGDGQVLTRGGTQVVFEPPKLETQPWVKDLYSWFSTHTVGIARVDLARPMPPTPEQYRGNLLFANKGEHPAAFNGGFAVGDNVLQTAGGNGRSGRVAGLKGMFLQDDWMPRQGARMKVTRSFLLGRNDADPFHRPLADLGLGFSVEDSRINPVVRLKIRDLVSIKMFPNPLLKFAHTFKLAGKGMALRVLYDCPLWGLDNPFSPPARLMVRLDHCTGRGIHLTPGGLEFDETVLRLGAGLSLRAAASLNFPRRLPIDVEEDDLGIKIQRLTLKTLW